MWVPKPCEYGPALGPAAPTTCSFPCMSARGRLTWKPGTPGGHVGKMLKRLWSVKLSTQTRVSAGSSSCVQLE